MVRTTIEAMAATQGHTQSLHTNALDEALALPTDFSARIARNTQIVLQQESGTTRMVDLWGGSFFVERFTYELAKTAWGHIQEVEEMGGMAKAIEAGLPKLRIEEASAKTQARIDAGQQVVIGVNKYRPSGNPRSTCSRSTTRRCGNCRSTSWRASGASATRRRSTTPWPRSRNAAGGNGNLFALAIDAARAKATVGEISSALEQVFGAIGAEIKAITGVYKREVGAMSEAVARVQKLVTEFEATEGRRPRILVAKIGQDGHDRGQKVIATAFADLGFDVDIGPCSRPPRRPRARRSRTTSTCWACPRSRLAHLTLVPQLKAALARKGRDDIMIVVGGVVPPQDYEELERRRRRGDLPAGHRDRRGRGSAARQAQPAAGQAEGAE